MSIIIRYIPKVLYTLSTTRSATLFTKSVSCSTFGPAFLRLLSKLILLFSTGITRYTPYTTTSFIFSASFEVTFSTKALFITKTCSIIMVNTTPTYIKSLR